MVGLELFTWIEQRTDFFYLCCVNKILKQIKYYFAYYTIVELNRNRYTCTSLVTYLLMTFNKNNPATPADRQNIQLKM